MAFVTNHDELVAFFGQLGDFNMNLGDQWAGCIKNTKAPLLSFALYGLAHPVRAEDQSRSRRHFGQIFNENRSLGFQIIDHIGVVNNFMPDIDGASEFDERFFHNLNGAIHACAKAAWFSK